MKKTSKRLTALLLSGAMAVMATGCGTSQQEQVTVTKNVTEESKTTNATEESKTTDKVNITMAVWSSSAAALQEEAANAFNATQDRINFTVEMQSGDYAQYLGAKTVAEDLPDLFYINPYSQLQEYAKNGYLLDLSDQPFTSKIYDDTKGGVMYDGKIYGYPCNIEYWGIFYNVEMFEKAGITEIPTTFSQLEQVCETLKANGITPFASTYKDAWACEQIFSALFASALQDDAEQWIVQMNQGETTFNLENVDTVFRFMDLMKENSGTNYMDADSTAGYNSFASGDAAMILLGNFALRPARNINPDIQVDMMAIPISEDPQDAKIMCNTSVGIVVNPKGQHVEEALEVLEFLADNTEGAKNWTTILLDSYGGALPSMPITLTNVVDEPYYKSAVQYVADGKTMVKPSNQLNSGALEALKLVQGYFADMYDQQETLDQLDEAILKLAE